jgi:predicted transcriptional regulator
LFVADLDIVPLVKVAPDATLGEVAGLLDSAHLGTVLVGDDVVYEFTEHDVVHAVAAGAAASAPIDDVPHGTLAVVAMDTCVEDVATIMLATGRRSVIVVDAQDEPVGVVELRVVAAALWGGSSWLGALRLGVEGVS